MEEMVLGVEPTADRDYRTGLEEFLLHLS